MDEAKAALMLRFLVGDRTMRAATRAKLEGHSYVDWSLKLERLPFRRSGVEEVVSYNKNKYPRFTAT
jgi:hypothetical protein